MVKEIIYNVKKQRGERLKLAREALGLSRRVLCEKYKHYGLSVGTIQSWEEARWGGLTQKGAEKLVQAFRDEGLDISVPWLLDGIGNSPISLRMIQKDNEPKPQNTIAYEVRLFHELHENIVDMAVTDDAMQPYLQPGDHIAGKWCSLTDLAHISDLLCIIELKSNDIFIRFLNYNPKSQIITLSNPCAKASSVILNLDVTKIRRIAPVQWIRKPGLID